MGRNSVVRLVLIVSRYLWPCFTSYTSADRSSHGLLGPHVLNLWFEQRLIWLNVYPPKIHKKRGIVRSDGQVKWWLAMAHKQILFHSGAREKILHGTAALADAVRVTLGPKSKSVLIQKKWGAPIVCNDGVTIAKEVDLKDPEENLGAQMLRQAAEKTGEAVGDGTSTSTILAQAIFADGTRNVVAGASAIDIKRGLDRGLKIAVEALRAMSRPVKTRKEKAQVATISAHNDPSIGELVADAMEKVGDEGVITVEESKTTETVLEVVEGMQFDRGFISPYFITDAEKMEAVLEDALCLPVRSQDRESERSPSSFGAGGQERQAHPVRGRGR